MSPGRIFEQTNPRQLSHTNFVNFAVFAKLVAFAKAGARNMANVLFVRLIIAYLYSYIDSEVDG